MTNEELAEKIYEIAHNHTWQGKEGITAIQRKLDAERPEVQMPCNHAGNWTKSNDSPQAWVCGKCGATFFSDSQRIALPTPAERPEERVCEGPNCGCTDGVHHSPECIAEKTSQRMTLSAERPEGHVGTVPTAQYRELAEWSLAEIEKYKDIVRRLDNLFPSPAGVCVCATMNLYRACTGSTDIKLAARPPIKYISFEITHCPFCGKPVREEKEKGTK